MLRMARGAVALIVMIGALGALASPAAAQQSGARVRILHAAPGAPAMDVYLDGVRTQRGLAFGAASEYVDVPAGARSLQFVPAGQPADQPALSVSAPFQAGASYTVAVAGQVSSLTAQVLADDQGAPPAGQAAVRVIHLVPDAPAVDVRVRGGPALATSLAFLQRSPKVHLAAGTYDLVVSPAGLNIAALEIPQVSVAAGTVYDVYAIGLLGGTPRPTYRVLVRRPAAPPAASPPAAEPARVCFPETGKCAGGRFLQYWRQNGGLAVFGYPLTDELTEGGRTVQYFERQRFELHPENPAPYDVLIGRLGDELLRRQGIDWQTLPKAGETPPGCRFFPETGHNVCDLPGGPAFLSYWSSHGLAFERRASQPPTYAESLALFGLPLSEPMEMTIEGRTLLVQWFERARFEWHPDNPPASRVLLGRLAAEALAGDGAAGE